MENIQKMILIISVIAIVLSSISIFGLILTRNNNSVNHDIPINFKVNRNASFQGTGSSNQNVNPSTIRVTGRYTEYVKPDTIEISLGVVEQATTSQEAFNKVSQAMQRIVAKILDLGVQRENITTTSISLTPVYQWKDKTYVLIGYKASNIIKIEVTDVNLTSKIIDSSVELGATKIYGIRFHLSQEQYKKIYLKALEEATRDAKEKAQVIANALGVKIIGVQSVSIGEIYIPRDIPIFYEAKSIQGSTPVMEGKTTVSATVNVVFLISNE